eukprot:22710-Amphidinium_carterae.1
MWCTCRNVLGTTWAVESVGSLDARLSWYEFLHLMRMAQDRAEFDAVNCEEVQIASFGPTKKQEANSPLSSPHSWSCACSNCCQDILLEKTSLFFRHALGLQHL